MYDVRLQVVEQALVVGDDDGARLWGAQLVEAFCHDAQGVHVEAAVRLVEDGELRFEHRHLEYLVALLLAAREALVHAAVCQLAVQLHDGTLLPHELEEVASRHGVEALILALGVEGSTHEVDHRHAWNLDRLLEAEEDALVGTFLGLEL